MRESKANPRASWEFYGIDKVQQKILKELMRSDEYASMVQTVAFAANEIVALYLIKSVLENKSYDRLEFDRELGRIACGRTDFYGIRRYFYYLFHLKLKEHRSK